MYFLYILLSINYKKTYVGITDDINRRLKEHNNGYGIYTKRYRPWILIYNESLEERVDARIREKYFKSASGRKKISEIINN